MFASGKESWRSQWQGHRRSDQVRAGIEFLMCRRSQVKDTSGADIAYGEIATMDVVGNRLERLLCFSYLRTLSNAASGPLYCPLTRLSEIGPFFSETLGAEIFLMCLRETSVSGVFVLFLGLEPYCEAEGIVAVRVVPVMWLATAGSREKSGKRDCLERTRMRSWRQPLASAGDYRRRVSKTMVHPRLTRTTAMKEPAKDNVFIASTATEERWLRSV